METLQPSKEGRMKTQHSSSVDSLCYNDNMLYSASSDLTVKVLHNIFSS